MKIIVVGYGRVGSQFVKKLDLQEHQVTVIDRQRSTLLAADPPRGVRLMVGNAIDEGLLRDGGAEQADVILALTRDENSNLMVAQIAKVLFNVPRVIAVVYETERIASFRDLGIETLAIAVAGADLLTARISGTGASPVSSLDAWQPGSDSVPHEPIRSIEAAEGSFYVLVVGGGLMGFYLARDLLQNGHEVTMIENDPEIHEIVSHQVDCPVLQGDGSSPKVLERAGASRANVICAVTNHDQDNLIACQVARYRFGIPKTIARVKNPKNEAVMRRLGVDTTVSSTAIITKMIGSELPSMPVRTLTSLSSCGMSIAEYHLNSVAPVVGKSVRDVLLPPPCSIIGVQKSGKLITNLDGLFLDAGDEVVALVNLGQEDQLRRTLLG
jgi:trk/ktr system potassium uptake protein